MPLYSQSLNNNYMGVQTSLNKNDFLFTEVWTPFLIGVKVDHYVASLSPFLKDKRVT